MTAPSPVQVFDAKTKPRFTAPSQIVCRYDKGEIALSVTVYRALGGDEVRSIAILEIGKGFHLTRADKTPTGWWLNRSSKKSGTNTIIICNKPVVRYLMECWGYGEGDVVKIPVTTNPIEDYPGLDRELYPFPLFRLLIQPHVVKTK